LPPQNEPIVGTPYIVNKRAETWLTLLPAELDRSGYVMAGDDRAG
jgi:hypothetical protein